MAIGLRSSQTVQAPPTGDHGIRFYPGENPYTPDPTHSHNSATGSSGNTVYGGGSGQYIATFDGLAVPGGNAQVVAALDDPARCKLVDWVDDTEEEVVAVDCRTAGGSPLHDSFDVVFASEVGLTGVEARKSACLRADQPSTSSYEPAQQWNSRSMTPATVRRVAAGTYSVTLPGMPRGGSAQVTAVGEDRAACTITGIRLESPQRIGVRCHRPTGDPADSAFSLTYTR
jgi:hypothetical protein